MGCAAEVISLGEVRARKQWETLRQHLHDRFDQWLDGSETQLPEPEPTLGEVCKTIWAMGPQLTGGLAEPIVQHSDEAEQSRQHMTCLTCECLLSASVAVERTVETMRGGGERD